MTVLTMYAGHSIETDKTSRVFIEKLVTLYSSVEVSSSVYTALYQQRCVCNKMCVFKGVINKMKSMLFSSQYSLSTWVDLLFLSL